MADSKQLPVDNLQYKSLPNKLSSEVPQSINGSKSRSLNVPIVQHLNASSIQMLHSYFIKNTRQLFFSTFQEFLSRHLQATHSTFHDLMKIKKNFQEEKQVKKVSLTYTHIFL